MMHELPPILQGSAEQQIEQLREYLLRMAMQGNNSGGSQIVVKGEKGDKGDRGPKGDPGEGGGISLEQVYPIGAIYISTVATDPATLFGFGTWERIKDTFLLSAGDTYAAGNTGGEATHKLTVDEMPSHSHGIQLTSSAVQSGSSFARISSTGSVSNGLLSDTGGSQPHNNMPPYLAVYMWKRTA